MTAALYAPPGVVTCKGTGKPGPTPAGLRPVPADVRFALWKVRNHDPIAKGTDPASIAARAPLDHYLSALNTAGWTTRELAAGLGMTSPNAFGTVAKRIRRARASGLVAPRGIAALPCPNPTTSSEGTR